MHNNFKLIYSKERKNKWSFQPFQRENSHVPTNKKKNTKKKPPHTHNKRQERKVKENMFL